MSSEAAQKVKEGLATRGISGIASLGIAFRNFDTDGNRKLARDELNYGLQDYGVTLDHDEFAQLLAEFDTNGDGVLNYDEFLVGIRGGLTDGRKEYVMAAYAKLDSNGSGTVNIDDIKATYNTDECPQVVSGEKTADQIFEEFMGCLGDKNTDGVITQKEFIDYYAALSASVDTDEQFAQILTNAWKL